MRIKAPDAPERILSAATRLFGTQRFHEVRMDDIAAAADVGKGTLYRYFADKEELYRAILAHSAELFLRRLEEIVAGDGPPRKRLEALVAGVIAHFDAEPHLLDLIQRAEALDAKGLPGPWQRSREEVPRLIRALFAEAAAVGDFYVPDEELTVLMLLGGLRAVIRFGPRPRPRGLAQRIVAGVLDGAADRGRRAGEA